MGTMSVNEFIDTVILDELDKMINAHHFYYLGFILVSTSIEFTGALLDQEDFSKPNLAEERFIKALKLFPTKYSPFTIKNNQHYLYKHLRCGMVHMLRPNHGVVFTHKAEAINGPGHLALSTDNQLILIIEELFSDLCNVINKIRNGNLRTHLQKNLGAPFLSVSNKAYDASTLSEPTSGCFK